MESPTITFDQLIKTFKELPSTENVSLNFYCKTITDINGQVSMVVFKKALLNDKIQWVIAFD